MPRKFSEDLMKLIQTRVIITKILCDGGTTFKSQNLRSWRIITGKWQTQKLSPHFFMDRKIFKSYGDVSSI